jgi:PncC family amidohydrolase
MDCSSDINELADLLNSRKLTLSLAESCTGGMVGSLITDCPGASQYFTGSAVTYTDSSKELVLMVKHSVLAEHGAVSEETAKDMAVGARIIFHAKIATSNTGIAGPTGATAEKPLGLVYIAVTDGHDTLCKKYNFEGDRAAVREQTAQAVLRDTIEFIRSH